MASISGEEKEELLSIWMRYKVAPLTVDQSKEGLVSQVWLALAGDSRIGAVGGGSMVKLHTGDHGPLPQLLDALARQK